MLYFCVIFSDNKRFVLLHFCAYSFSTIYYLQNSQKSKLNNSPLLLLKTKNKS